MPSIQDTEQLSRMVDTTVKREVEVYCAEYLPGIIRKELSALGFVVPEP